MKNEGKAVANTTELLAFAEQQAAATTGDTQQGWRFVVDEIAGHISDTKEPGILLWMVRQLANEDSRFHPLYADVLPVLETFVEA